MKLGAIRLAGRFTQGKTGPIGASLYRQRQDHVRGVAVHSVQRARARGFDVMYGSSGTILNLAEIVARSKGETVSGPGYSVALADLEAQVSRLCALRLEQRGRIPGRPPTVLRPVPAAGGTPDPHPAPPHPPTKETAAQRPKNPQRRSPPPPRGSGQG